MLWFVLGFLWHQSNSQVMEEDDKHKKEEGTERHIPHLSMEKGKQADMFFFFLIAEK